MQLRPASKFTCADEGRLAKVAGQLAKLWEVGCPESSKLQTLGLRLRACSLACALPKGRAGHVVEGVDGLRLILLQVVGRRSLPGVVSPRLTGKVNTREWSCTIYMPVRGGLA